MNPTTYADDNDSGEWDATDEHQPSLPIAPALRPNESFASYEARRDNHRLSQENQQLQSDCSLLFCLLVGSLVLEILTIAYYNFR